MVTGSISISKKKKVSFGNPIFHQAFEETFLLARFVIGDLSIVLFEYFLGGVFLEFGQNQNKITETQTM